MSGTGKDYYAILEVERTATAEEIKTAYKKQAIKYHPDRNPGNKEAEERFKEAAAAYDVLRDPDKRARYDQFGEAGINGQGFGGGYSASSMNMDDIFSMFGNIFGGRNPFGDFGGFSENGYSGMANEKPRGGDLRMRVKLTLEEIAKGVTKKFKVKKYVPCSECNGSGSEKGGSTDTCPTCHGRGFVIHQQRSLFGIMQTQDVCPTCGGEGKIIKNKCHHCNGEGVVIGEEIVEVNIPAGVSEGMIVNVPRKGNAGRHGGENGNLQVIIEEEQHDTFIREDNNLIYNLLLTIAQATLGDTVDIPTIDGMTKISIKPGTQPGKVLRLRGKGLPSVKGYGDGTGDLVVNVSVYIPENINSKERELFESIKESENLQPDKKTKDNIFKRFRALFE